MIATDPAVRAEVVEGPSAQVAAGVRDGSLHLGVCYADAAAPAGVDAALQRRELMVEPMRVALAAGHRLAGRRTVGLVELADEPWIAGLRDGLIRRACVAAGFEPRLAFQTADPLATRALVAAGLGVTLVPAFTTLDARPAVRTLAVRGDGPRRSVYALTPIAGRLSAVVARTLEALAEAADDAQSQSVAP